MFEGKSIRREGWEPAGDIDYSGGPPSTMTPAYSVTNPVSIADVSTQPSGVKEESPSLADKGIFIISEGFTPVLAKNVLTWILEANLNPNRTYNHLTLIINSPGGQVPSAFAIIDAMKGSKLPVHTIGLGQISSCGLLTFLAGEKGHRILTPNTGILSHQWAWASWGKEHELFAAVKEFDMITKRILNHYKACTGLTEEVIRERLLPAQDVWLSSEEALELNICDEVRVMGA